MVLIARKWHHDNIARKRWGGTQPLSSAQFVARSDVLRKERDKGPVPCRILPLIESISEIFDERLRRI